MTYNFPDACNDDAFIYICIAYTCISRGAKENLEKQNRFFVWLYNNYQ